jgi:hypothetical protein
MVGGRVPFEGQLVLLGWWELGAPSQNPRAEKLSDESRVEPKGIEPSELR